MLPTTFQVNWPFGSGLEVKNIYFQDGRHGGHIVLPIGTSFAIFFLSTSHPNASYKVSIGLLIQEKKRKIDFQDGHHGGHRTDFSYL